ncbi:MAG TPA: ribbon-helix-helix protein, CopG family [Polyangiaceae bacterium]
MTRLNARLDEKLAKKVAYLREATRGTTTDVIRRSIEHYYESVRKESRLAREVLEEVGFIGSAEGPTNLSRDYKDDLTVLLSRKS